MIVDSIENAFLYYPLNPGIAEALAYIKNNDLSKVLPGKYEISHNKVSMIVNEYDQKCTDRTHLEAHRKNIDVQYWVSGSELMGYAPLGSQVLRESFNEAEDFGIYETAATFTRLVPGMFAIYFPTDLHTANVDEMCDSKVRKIVFKVAVS